jgi:hypothetical protein
MRTTFKKPFSVHTAAVKTVSEKNVSVTSLTMAQKCVKVSNAKQHANRANTSIS